MSMPKFPDKKDILSRDAAINAIVTSIAMEEMALSRILEAESEKITKVLEGANLKHEKDREAVLCINRSVSQLVERIGDLQLVLKSKLRLVTEVMPQPCPCPPCPKPCPPHPPWPPVPPKPHPCKCVNVFCADSKYIWSPCRTLALCQLKCCDDCVHTARINGDSVIVLPHGGRFDIDLTLRLVGRTQEPVAIELRQNMGKATVFSKNYKSDGKHHVNIHDRLTLFSEGAWDNHLSLRLLSQHSLEIVKACVEVKSGHSHTSHQ